MRELETPIDFIHSLTEFGESALGLTFGENFKHFDQDHPEPNWLYVSQRLSIESVVNSNGPPFIDVLGKREECEALQQNFELLGFDTYLYTAEGWGGEVVCPILPLLLEQLRVRQAYVVLHEGLHITLRAQKIKIPYELEEPAAIAIADLGTIAFAEENGARELLRELLLLKVFRKKFAQAVNQASRMLDECYRVTADKGRGEKEAEREKLLGTIRADSIWQDAEEAGVTVRGLNRSQSVNNAFFLRYGTYYTHLSLVEAALRSFANTREAVTFLATLPPKLKEAIMCLERISK